MLPTARANTLMNEVMKALRLTATASEGHTEVVKILAEAKAEIDAKDADGTNAVMAAAAKGHLMLPELLKAGAKVNEQNPMVTLLSCLQMERTKSRRSGIQSVSTDAEDEASQNRWMTVALAQ
jgi:ankyrin repeat protein